MVNKTKLPYTAEKRNSYNGKREWWFRRAGRWTKLPGDPGTDEEASKLYWKLRTGADKPPRAQTVAELIKSYRKSPAYRNLKPATRDDYERRLAYIESSAGNVRAARITRAHVVAARDANAEKPSRATKIVTMLSALMEHAIDLGWRTDNPARGVKGLPGGPGHEPWTEAQITRFRAVATGHARTAFELCLGTGQRIGDVLRMKWDDIEDGGINVVQQKTGAELWIPFTPDLAAYLDTLPRGARTTIITTRKGTPIGHRHMLKLIDRAKQMADVEGAVPHGLRKNATIELLEAGCSDAEVMAITGHKSSDMVRLYGKRVRQRKLAKQARERKAR